jgi:hypothetical protein
MGPRAHRHDKQNAAPQAEELARRIDRLARRRWSSADGFTCLTLGTGEDALTLYAPAAAADAFLETVSAAGAALDDGRAELARLRKRVETLEHALSTAHDAESASRRQGAARGTTGADGAHAATLESVPAALIAPFHPDARVLTAAKENPLIALAVQATKAMQSDAGELERARLLAMAYAASTGDMTRFWAARTQRSAKKMIAP